MVWSRSDLGLHSVWPNPWQLSWSGNSILEGPQLSAVLWVKASSVSCAGLHFGGGVGGCSTDQLCDRPSLLQHSPELSPAKALKKPLC